METPLALTKGVGLKGRLQTIAQYFVKSQFSLFHIFFIVVLRRSFVFHWPESMY